MNRVTALDRDRLMGRHSEEVTVSRAEKEVPGTRATVSHGRGRQGQSSETCVFLVFLRTLSLKWSEVEAGQSRLNKPHQLLPFPGDRKPGMLRARLDVVV